MTSETATSTEAAPGNEPWNQPAPWIVFLRKHVWLIGGLMLFLMITVMRPLMIRRPPPPEITGEVPTFSLVDHGGESFTRDVMLAEDKVWVVDPNGYRWEVFVVLEDNLPEGASPKVTGCCVADQPAMVQLGGCV